MKREPMPTAKPPPDPRWVEGSRVYVCVGCHDTGYRAIEVEHGFGEKARRAAAMTPCQCDYGRAVAENLAACQKLEEPKHRVPHHFARQLPYGPYDLGRDESDPRTQ